MVDLLALLYSSFSCVFGAFPYSVLDLTWYLSVLIPDSYLLPKIDMLKYIEMLKASSHRPHFPSKYEGRSICNENSPEYPKLLYLQTS